LLYDIIFEGILTTALLVPKSFHSTLDWQEGFFKRRCCSSSEFSFSQIFSVSSCNPKVDVEIRSPCGAPAVFQIPWTWKNLTGLLQLMGKWMFGNVNWYFLLTHYSKIY